MFEIVVKRRVFRDLSFGTFDSIVCGGRRFQLGIAPNCVTQFLLARPECGPSLWIQQPGEITVVTFSIVLVAEKIVTRLPCILKRARAVSQLQHFAPVKHSQEIRQPPIARVGQFIQRELPICFARASAHKCQFAVARAARIPFQEIVDLRWLTILVNAKKADIEVEARIFEIVRVAAKKSHLLFRCENQADVVVTLVPIKMVITAPV